jgi:hypothetical protein
MLKEFQKSTRSGAQGCVELGVTSDGTFLIRDSKNPDGSVLAFNEHEIAAFLEGAKAGEFDHFVS